MICDDSDSIKLENDLGNEDSDHIKCISDEPNVYDKDPVNINERKESKSKKPQRLGESLALLKLLNQKDKISQKSAKQCKSKSTKVNENTVSNDDEIYDEDGDQMENERQSTLIKKDEGEHPKVSTTQCDEEYDEDDGQEPQHDKNKIPHNQVTQTCVDVDKISVFKPSKFFKIKLKEQNKKPKKSKPVLGEEYDEDHDLGASQENIGVFTEIEVTQNNIDTTKPSPLKSFKFFNKKPQGHDIKGKSSKDFLNEVYDEDDDLEIIDMSNDKGANMIQNKSSPISKNQSRGQYMDPKSKLKNLKEKQDDGELYDEDLCDAENESDCFVRNGSTEVFQKDRGLKYDSDDIYDEDEDFQGNTRVTNDNRNYDRSPIGSENVPRKSSKLKLSKKYVNQQMKNLKIKEKIVSDYIKKKFHEIKQFSTSPREDKVEEICENEAEYIYDDDDLCEIADSSCGTETTHDTCPTLIDGKSNNFKNFKAKKMINDDDKTSPQEKNTNDSMKEDVEIYDDDESENEYEDQTFTSKSEYLISNNSCLDDHSTVSQNVIDSSSKLEPMVKFFNKKIKKIKKSKTLIANRLNLKLKAINDILANHMASNEDGNVEECASDSSLIRNPGDKELNNRCDAESNDSDEHLIEEGKLRNIPKDINFEDRKFLGDPQSSRETRAVTEKAQTSRPFKVKQSKSLKQKWNTFDTKRKQFSNDFLSKMKKVNSNELYDDDNVGTIKIVNYDEEYFDENEEENENIGENVHRNDSQAIKRSNSDEVMIQKKNLACQKPTKFQLSFQNHNKQMKITKVPKVKHVWKVEKKSKTLNTENPNSVWHFPEDISTDSIVPNKETQRVKVNDQVNKNDTDNIKGLKDICKNKKSINENKKLRKRENMGENINNDPENKMIVNVLENPAETSKFQKTKGMHQKKVEEVHFKNKQRGSDSIRSEADDLNSIQNNNPLGITALIENSLDDLLDKKIQLLMEKWYEKAGHCESSTSKSNDSGHVLSPETTRTENNMKIEVLNEEMKEKEASIAKRTRSDSFPVIKKRYNLQMCLEYFEMSREIVDITTEILDNGQQMVHITLGEAGRNLTCESDIEAMFRTNSKVDTFSSNEGNNFFFNEGKKRIFRDFKNKNESKTSEFDKDNCRTSKQISTKTCENCAASPLSIPSRIPSQNKLSTRDMDLKQTKSVDKAFERDQNKFIPSKTSPPFK